MLVALSLLSASGADAPDPPEPTDQPHLWVRGYGAIAFFPTGLIADVAAEARFPVLRLGGAIFNDTFVGTGVRVAASPAHLDLAVRTTFKPMDILPITVEGVYTNFWESPFGVVPMETVSGQLPKDRRPLYQADRDYAAYALSASVSPTIQLKVGSIAAFSNVMITWLRVRPIDDDPEPWIFDPYRGMVIANDDRILDHTSAILFDPYDGKGTPIFRVGAALRGRAGQTTKDVTLMAGGILQWRPGKQSHDPDLTLIVAPYLRDPDFSVGVPFIAALVTVSRVVPFKRLDRK